MLLINGQISSPKTCLFGDPLLTFVYVTFILVSIEYKIIWNVKCKLLAKHLQCRILNTWWTIKWVFSSDAAVYTKFDEILLQKHCWHNLAHFEHELDSNFILGPIIIWFAELWHLECCKIESNWYNDAQQQQQLYS